MEELIKTFNELRTAIPLDQILIGIGILLVGKLIQVFFSRIILGRVEEWTKGTETDIDDRLLEVIKPPLNWLIILFSLWIVSLLVSGYLSSDVNQSIAGFISVAFVFILSYIIFVAAPILGEVVELFTLQTETDLDDLLVPYIPKLIRTVAVMLFIIKAAETFLGASAGALIGLLGGAGVAMGLLFKDIIYDWCCAVIIYTDGIYRPGDWVAIDGMGGFIQIKEIGLRSTSLWSINWGSIKKIPNSTMISGVVENWSQDRGKKLEWGLCSKVQIDGISAKKTNRVLDSIEALVSTLESSSEGGVKFDGLEGNARVISIRTYVNDANLYFSNQRTLHLGILEILENEGIDHMHVVIRTDPLKLDKSEKAINN